FAWVNPNREDVYIDPTVIPRFMKLGPDFQKKWAEGILNQIAELKAAPPALPFAPTTVLVPTVVSVTGPGSAENRPPARLPEIPKKPLSVPPAKPVPPAQTLAPTTKPEGAEPQASRAEGNETSV